MCPRDCYLVFIYGDITLAWVSALSLLHDSTNIILFLTRHNRLINDEEICVSLALFLFWWWCHNRVHNALWDTAARKHCEVISVYLVRYQFYSRRYSRPIAKSHRVQWVNAASARPFHHMINTTCHYISRCQFPDLIITSVPIFIT